MASGYVERGDRPELYEFNGTLGYRMRPHIKDYKFSGVEWGNPIVRTNQYGFRGADFPAKKPPGEKRVFLIGDSVVAGLEVPEDKTMAAQLEKLLGHGVRVINAGTRGYSTAQEKLLLDKVIAPLSPNAVVVVTVPNDPSDNVQIKKPARPFQRAWIAFGGQAGVAPIELPFKQMPDNMGAWLENASILKTQTKSKIWMLNRHFQNWRRSLAIHKVIMMRLGKSDLEDEEREVGAEGLLTPPSSSESKDQFRLYKYLIQSMSYWGLIGDSRGFVEYEEPINHFYEFPILYTSYVSKENFDRKLLALPKAQAHWFENFTRNAAMENFISLAKPVEAALKAHQPIMFKNDPHLTAEGHRLYAEGLAPALRKALNLPYSSP